MDVCNANILHLSSLFILTNHTFTISDLFNNNNKFSFFLPPMCLFYSDTVNGLTKSYCDNFLKYTVNKLQQQFSQYSNEPTHVHILFITYLKKQELFIIFL